MLNTYMNESLIYEVKSIARSQGYQKLQKGTQQGDVYSDKRHRITQETQDQNTGICTGLPGCVWLLP